MNNDTLGMQARFAVNHGMQARFAVNHGMQARFAVNHGMQARFLGEECWTGVSAVTTPFYQNTTPQTQSGFP